jgi:hypothetical protein
MSLYTQEQLLQRKAIFQSQKLLWNLLDSDTINNLIRIFDIRNNVSSKTKLETYIEEERSRQGLDNTNITIKSEVYGENTNDSTLIIDIQKDNKKFLHLSIHLSPQSLKPQNTGVLHIVKNIYNDEQPAIPSKKSVKRLKAALISVQQPVEKPKSLIFTLADGYTTSPKIQYTNLYDPLLQKEMDVILTVLNRLFDEEDEYYIGNTTGFIPYHNKSSPVLQNMNVHTTHVTRKNRGKGIIPFLKNGFHSVIRRRPYQKTPRKRNSKRITRKRGSQKNIF